MKIIVTDRDTLEAGLVVRSRYAAISITDPDKPDAKVPKTSGCHGLLRLKFDDAEPSPGFAPSAVVLCCEKDGERIVKFVNEHRGDVGAFVVHCEAGMSRSPAVAAAIAEHLGEDPTPFFARYVPNAFVFRVVREALRRHESTTQTPDPSDEDD